MFSAYHPFTLFLYMILITVSSITLIHPALLAVSIAAAVYYAISQKAFASAMFVPALALPLIFLFALINPLVNHRGTTFLFYIRNNPITFEAFASGLFSGIMLVTVMLWFVGFNGVMTSDKLLYLLSKLSPSVALLTTMSLRLVPLLKNRTVLISNAQKSIGADIGAGSLTARLKNGTAIISALITWSLEDSIETSDSMNARGYGSRKRSAYKIFSFKKRDLAAIVLMLCFFAALMLFFKQGRANLLFFPAIKATPPMLVLPAVFIYLLLCFTPKIFEIAELIYWKLSR